MDGTGVSGVGQCKDGVYACQVPVDGTGAPTGPARNVCVNAVGPKTEFCDGKDNDCDGNIDEGNPPRRGDTTASISQNRVIRQVGSRRRGGRLFFLRA